jgi:hypothetical protein
MPGVMAYGASRESAVASVRALALRVAADCIDHGAAEFAAPGYKRGVSQRNQDQEIGKTIRQIIIDVAVLDLRPPSMATMPSKRLHRRRS